MARTKRGVVSRAKHNKVLKSVKGQRGRRKNTIRIARQAMEKAMQYAYRDRKAKQDERETAVLDNIADMLFNEKFQNLLQHSTPKEIDQKVQAFLA